MHAACKDLTRSRKVMRGVEEEGGGGEEGKKRKNIREKSNRREGGGSLYRMIREECAGIVKKLSTPGHRVKGHNCLVGRYYKLEVSDFTSENRLPVPTRGQCPLSDPDIHQG